MAALRELFILNNAEQRLVVFDDLPVADANLGNLAVHFAVDLVHQLHGLNDAERVTLVHRVAHGDERLAVRRRRGV